MFLCLCIFLDLFLTVARIILISTFFNTKFSNGFPLNLEQI